MADKEKANVLDNLWNSTKNLFRNFNKGSGRPSIEESETCGVQSIRRLSPNEIDGPKETGELQQSPNSTIDKIHSTSTSRVIEEGAQKSLILDPSKLGDKHVPDRKQSGNPKTSPINQITDGHLVPPKDGVTANSKKSKFEKKQNRTKVTGKQHAPKIPETRSSSSNQQNQPEIIELTSIETVPKLTNQDTKLAETLNEEEDQKEQQKSDPNTIKSDQNVQPISTDSSEQVEANVTFPKPCSDFETKPDILQSVEDIQESNPLTNVAETNPQDIQRPEKPNNHHEGTQEAKSLITKPEACQHSEKPNESTQEIHITGVIPESPKPFANLEVYGRHETPNPNETSLVREPHIFVPIEDEEQEKTNQNQTVTELTNQHEGAQKDLENVSLGEEEAPSEEQNSDLSDQKLDKIVFTMELANEAHKASYDLIEGIVQDIKLLVEPIEDENEDLSRHLNPTVTLLENEPKKEQDINDFEESTIAKVQSIQQELSDVEKEIGEFVGTTANDREYLYLDEVLMRYMIKFDNIQTGNNELVRQERKKGVKLVQQMLKQLDAKLKENQCNKDGSDTVEI